jgi:hypothetical protein
MALRQLICFSFYKTCAKKLKIHGQFFKKKYFFDSGWKIKSSQWYEPVNQLRG